MAAQNPNGEMLYWDEGAPFEGVKQGSIVNTEMLYWDSGFPMVYYIPNSAAALRMWGYIIF